MSPGRPELRWIVVFGGLVGAGVGLLAGLPLVFLVGRPRVPTDLPRGEEWLELVWFPAASLLGGPLAARAATRVMPRTDVS